MPRTLEAEPIIANESIAEFLERSVYIRRVTSYGSGASFRYEPHIFPHQVVCDVSEYAYDLCGTEQEEPVDGVRYTFYLGRSVPEAPIGGWQFQATAHREGDVVLLEIEEA
jgi:hypothetical protein